MTLRRNVPRLLALWLLVGMCSTFLPAAEKPSEAALRTAKHLWEVADLVLDKHIAPPKREKMMLAAVRSLTRDPLVSLQLADKIADVTTPEQLAHLLQELWPQTPEGKPAGEKELTLTLAQVMLQGDDPRAGFVPPEEYKVAEQLSQNRYVGIGVQIAWNSDAKLAEIRVPFPGGPARKAGARPGDLILEVDGTGAENLPLGKVVELLRGEEGTPVRVVVRQALAAEKRELKMVRAVVPFALLVGYRRVGEEDWDYRVDLAAAVGYVRVTRLTSSALHELRQIERRLQADGCRALILDLRFTSEGDVAHGALVADAFLEGGLMGRVRDRQNNVKEYKADPDCLFRNWPVAVLVGAAASGAGTELLAGALQAQRRAVLVGTPTSGDRQVFTTSPLPEGIGFVRLPTARLELGESVRRSPLTVPLPKALGPARLSTVQPERDEPAQPSGLKPDHLVPWSLETHRAVMAWQAAQEKPGGAPEAKAPDDAALTKAMELLRAKLK